MRIWPEPRWRQSRHLMGRSRQWIQVSRKEEEKKEKMVEMYENDIKLRVKIKAASTLRR